MASVLNCRFFFFQALASFSALVAASPSALLMAFVTVFQQEQGFT